jgi:hypothetical protein
MMEKRPGLGAVASPCRILPGNCSSLELGFIEIVATLPMVNIRSVYSSAATSRAIFVRIIRAFILTIFSSFSHTVIKNIIDCPVEQANFRKSPLAPLCQRGELAIERREAQRTIQQNSIVPRCILPL